MEVNRKVSQVGASTLLPPSSLTKPRFDRLVRLSRLPYGHSQNLQRRAHLAHRESLALLIPVFQDLRTMAGQIQHIKTWRHSTDDGCV